MMLIIILNLILLASKPFLINGQIFIRTSDIRSPLSQGGQIILSSSSSSSSSSSASFRASFRSCCSLGKQASNMTLDSCIDYSRLQDNSSGCKFAFTICCNQNKRSNECDIGKRHAVAGLSCEDIRRDNACDALTDCCNCCELGIKNRKNGQECSAIPELNSECNSIYVDCCKNAAPSDDCSNSHFCPNGQICENTRNGPVCKCPSGYDKDVRSNTCVDVDECRKSYSICDNGSKCQNTVGSYVCTKSCGMGYLFNAIIVQCQDLNECARGTHNCATGMRCENYPGSFRCIREKPCGTGYSVNIYTQECDDVDECTLNLHDCSRGFICINVPGTFKCRAKECGHGTVFNYNTGDCEQIVCLPGYEIDSNNRCVDINECITTPQVCNFNERCENTPGSYKCILVLICDEGYELNANKTECVDIDECEIGRHNCPSMAQCVNTPGSYKCICPTGYRLDENRNQCEDIDECALSQVCPSNSYCRNTPGSYSCECKTGFTLVSHIFYSCVDDDECANNPNICDHKCVNTYGSYQCTCNEGYKLASDKRSCLDIDECALQPNICPGICRNTPGSYECSCPVGFVLDVRQRRVCEDIDECELKTHNCGQRDVCVNTRGLFKCIKLECPEGYTLIGDIKNQRCDRGNAVCKFADTDCLKQPMKIFYSYTSFSYLVPVPIRIFTTRVNTYSRRIRLQYEFKVVDSKGLRLREDQFMVKQTDPNTFDIYLLEPCKSVESLSLELKIDFYNDNQFSSCLLNRIFVFVTD